MGRSKFTQLKKCTESDNFVQRRENIYLYGSSGSGKSHILAAFVCQLIREGKRVVYIPDCRDLLENLDHTIRTALCFAFHNDPTSLQIIESALNVDGLVKFWITVDDKYLVVDQLNALEIDPNKDGPTAKREAVALLGKMRGGRRYIYSASANELSNRDVDLKQAPITIISFFGGMDEEETQQWFDHYSNNLPRLSEDDRRLVEYLTGCIPLLLSSLFEFKGKAFDERKFLGCSDLTKVNEDVTKYANEKLKKSQGEEARYYFEIIEACLQGARIEIDHKQYDLRYFYVEQGHGHYTCGVAFESMMLMLRERRFQQFNSTDWHAAVSATKNPVVQGFMAEQLCLHSISMVGLPAVASHLTRMEAVTFGGIPNWEQQIDAKFTLRLYIPTAYNFPNIDAILLWLDLESKAAHLYPIQITLSRNHKDSEDRFYVDNWSSWVEPLQGFTLKSTFVWIDKKQPSAQHKKAEIVSTRQGVKPVQPEHYSIHVGIGQVDERLGKNLNL